MRALKRCANGCDAPPTPPALVICRACQDRITGAATSASGQPARTARVRSRSFCGKPRMAERWAIKVVWSDGEEEYLKEGIRVAIFSSRSRAHEQADFMKIGMDDVQSIAVVKAPRG